MSGADDPSGHPARPSCPACRAELPSAFPGATVACACGHRVQLQEAARSSLPPSIEGAGPYRAAGAPHEPVVVARCPYCGNECPSMVRICPHCDVRLENVRCQRCFSLQSPGAFACLRCSHALELEPMLDATDAPCPRCSHPLEVSAAEDARAHECPRCGGMFVPRDALADILCSAEIGGALRETPRAHVLDEVRYVPCPLCHVPMNRVNFGRVSGVIVDVCKSHGTWFDAGELTRVVAFAASGGLEKTRAREEAALREEKGRVADAQVQLASMMTRDDPKTRLEMWSDFLRAILFW